MVTHFSGRESSDKPGVLVFPNILVCLDCGVSQYIAPKTELALLLTDTPTSDSSTPGRSVHEIAPLAGLPLPWDRGALVA
jgi:hypothetical protein